MKKFLKRYFSIALLIITGVVFAAPTNWSQVRQNSDLTLSQKAMEFTSDGTPTGTKVAQINSGGNVVIFNALKMFSGSTTIAYFNSGGVNYVSGLTFPGGEIKYTASRTYFSGNNVYIQGINTVRMLSTSNSIIINDNGIRQTLGTGAFIIQDDSINKYGIQYYTSYCATATGNSLIDKNCIQALVTGTLTNYVTLDTDQTITGTKTFEGTTYMNSAFIYRLGWMGSTNSGFSVDENGIEYDGFTCSDFGANSLMNKSCITALVTGYNTNLTNTYVPYRSGDRFYNSNITVTGNTTVIAGISLFGDLLGTGNIGGFNTTFLGYSVGFFGAVSGPSYESAGIYSQTENGAGFYSENLGTGIYSSNFLGDTLYGYGQVLRTTFGQGTKIAAKTGINNTGFALTIGRYSEGINAFLYNDTFYDALTIDYSGNISTVGNQTFINPTIAGQDFRFARSGGLMEGQYFTGGVRVSAMVYTLH